MKINKFVYKICTSSELSKAQVKKKFNGTAKDIKDGFIHLSKKNQVEKTLKNYYFNKDKLVLLKIDTSKLKKLVMEKSRDGILFPHLYSVLSLSDITKKYKILLTKNGSHRLPLSF
tara:strand:+ start:30 stop:377 length:348 start_codon:yes stop_codon:yes gene_type:complete